MSKIFIPALFTVLGLMVLPACSSDDDDQTPNVETENPENDITAVIAFTQIKNGESTDREGTANVMLVERDGRRGYAVSGFEYTGSGAIKFDLELVKAFEGNEYKQPETGDFNVVAAGNELEVDAFRVLIEDFEAGITYGDSTAEGSVIIRENGDRFLKGTFELTLRSKEAGELIKLENAEFIAVKDNGFSSL